ncbi:MAG TPA: hypothetical protein VF551_05815, partial [Chthoniobacterales bacterium]
MRVEVREWDDSELSRQFVVALAEDVVHVWYAVVPKKQAALAAMAQTLSAEEQERANRFGVAEARARF